MVNILLLKGYALLVEIIGCHGDQRLLQHELSRVQEGEGMKWEDTVLKDAYSEVDIPGDEGEGVIDITSRLEFQAKVAFKAGMREVVEWVTENEDKLFRGRQITFSKWQAFLKENGIEVNSE